MTVGTTSLTEETDPVRAALNDPSVQARVKAAACAFLSGRVYYLPPAQRAAEAEEIVQKVGLRALEHRSRFDPTREIVPWLVGYVANITREYVKKRGRCTTGPPAHAIELENLIAKVDPPEGDALSEQDQKLIERLQEHLNPADRELLRLSYAEDLTFAEIGERIGITENAARVRHHRLLNRLRKLAGCGEVQS